MLRELCINWYNAQTPQRQMENEFALYKNITSNLFSRIYLLNRGVVPVWATSLNTSVRVTVFDVREYPTFSDFLFLIKTQGELYDAQRIIANTDIYFDDTLREVNYMDVSTVICLSRWERFKRKWSLYRNHRCSQDSWIFPPRINLSHELVSACRFRMGTLGCDNRLAWTFQDFGLRAINPAYRVKSYHVHFSNQRFMDRSNSEDVVPPPYALLPATL